MKFIAGDTPTVVPPTSFAPIVASNGSPGHAPEKSIRLFFAMALPSALAASLTSLPMLPLAEPITPIWYLLILNPPSDGLLKVVHSGLIKVSP
ncbi:MAG: hypothetical protein WCY18_02500 [Methanofastidiosum sp.]